MKFGIYSARALRQIERANRFASSHRVARDLTRFSLLVVAAAAILHSSFYAGSVLDDAYVTYRHSIHIAGGHGLTCVPGVRILGTPSPLFAALMATAILAAADPYRAACVLGSLAFAGCALAAYATVRTCVRGSCSRFLGICAAGMVALSPSLAFHSQTGVETTIGSWLIAMAFSRHIAAVAVGKGDAAWAVFVALAALARPEAAWLFPALYLPWVVISVRRGASLTRLVRPASILVLVLCAWFLFQRIYLGTWASQWSMALSQPWEQLNHQSAHTLMRGVLDGPGLRRAFQYLTDRALTVSLMVGSMLMPRTRYAGVVGSGLVCISVALSVGLGQDAAIPDPLLAPCVAPIAVCVVLGVPYLLADLPLSSRWTRLPVVLGAFGFAFLATYLPWQRVTPDPGSNHVWRMRKMGVKLARLVGKQEVVVSDMPGMLAYYWGARTFDLQGRCVPNPFSRGSSTTERVNSLIALRPDWYAFEYTGSAARFYAQPAFAPERDQYLMLHFPKGYLRGFSLGPPTIFVRKGRPGNAELVGALQAQLVDPGSELRRIGFLQ